jgi:hypothetical protein
LNDAEHGGCDACAAVAALQHYARALQVSFAKVRNLKPHCAMVEHACQIVVPGQHSCEITLGIAVLETQQ